MTNEDFNKITYQINKNNNYTIDDNGSSDSSCYVKGIVDCGRDDDMLDIGSYYWLASAHSDSALYMWIPGPRYVYESFDYSHGVRPVVVLKSGVKFANDGKDGKSESTAFNLVAA